MRIAQAAAVLLIFAVIAMLLLLGFAKSQLAKLQPRLAPLIETSLKHTLGRDVHIGSVSMAGLGSFTIRDASVARGASFATGTAFTVPSATAHVNLIQLVLQRARNPVGAISQVVVQRPRLSVNRSADGQWDFQDVLDRIKANTNASHWHGQVIVRDGNVSYHDARGLGASPQPLNQEMAGVNARVTPGWWNHYNFNVTAHDPGQRFGQVQLAGYFQRGTGKAKIDIQAKHVVVKALQRYLPAHLPITFENGTAAVHLSALFNSLPRPEVAHTLSPDRLTAEVDLTGIGLRLDGMTAPIFATSGRLRLQHNAKRYPQGSRLQFINVHARANQVPLEIRGSINEINLFDLQHLNPQFNIHTLVAGVNGTEVSGLFPKLLLGQRLQLGGRFGLAADVTGRASALHIDGTLSTERFGVLGLALGQADATFHLAPTGRSAGQPTIQAQADIHSANWDTLGLSGLHVTLSSQTPWRHLNDHPEISGSATAEHIALTGFSADALRSAFTAGRNGITLTDLHAQLFGGQVTGNLTVPFQPLGNGTPRTLSATAGYQGIDVGQVAKLLHLPALSGSAQGTSTIKITPEAGLTLATTVQATDVQYRTYHARRVQADLRVAQGSDGLLGLAIPHATADTDYGRFTISDGSYGHSDTPDGKATLSLPITGEGIPTAKFAPGKIEGMASMQGMVTGPVDAPQLTARVSATNGAVLGHAFRAAHADLAVDAQQLRFRNMVLLRDGLEMDIAGGPQGFDPREEVTGLAATAHLHGAPVEDVLSLIELKNPWPITGAAEGDIHLTLATGDTTASGTVSIPDAVVYITTSNGVYPLALDRISGTFDYAQGMVRIHQAQIDRQGTQVLVDGSVGHNASGDPVRADLNFRSGQQAFLQDLPLDLFGVPVDLHGPVTLQGALTGVLAGDGPEPPAVSVRAASPQLAVEGLPAGTSNIALTYQFGQDQRELTIASGQVENAAFRATSHGVYHLSQGTTDNVAFDVEHIDLTALHNLAISAPTDGRFSPIVGAIAALPELAGSGEVHIAGTQHDTVLEATLAFAKLALHGTPLPDIHGKLSLPTSGNNRGIRIDELVASGGDGQGTARLSGSVGRASGLDLALSMQGITAKVLSPWIGHLPFDGNTSLAATVRGPWDAPVLDADLSVAQPTLYAHTLDKLAGHLHLGRDGLQFTDGRLWLTPGSDPATVAGQMPITWTDGFPQLQDNGALSLAVHLPQQSLDAVRSLLPDGSALQGTVEAGLQVGGTLAHPYLSHGNIALAGSAALPFTDGKLPNQVHDLNLRATLTGNGKQSQLTIAQGTATLDRLVDGKRPKAFQPGWVSTSGSVTIPAADLRDPNRWQWDVYAQITRLPLAPPLSLVPQVSGYLHLGEDSGQPLLTGVMLVDHTKVYIPTLLGSTKMSWGPFAFNPHFSIVLQVGEQVKLAKSIIRLPLRPTPLPVPPVSTATQPGAIQQNLPAFNDSAAMLSPDTSGEASGTWGVLTGSLNDPRLYMRFEVAKEKLTFPLSLIGSVRHARGHVTFSFTDGVHLAMGIPDFPEAQAAQAKASAKPVQAAATLKAGAKL